MDTQKSRCKFRRQKILFQVIFGIRPFLSGSVFVMDRMGIMVGGITHKSWPTTATLTNIDHWKPSPVWPLKSEDHILEVIFVTRKFFGNQIGKVKKKHGRIRWFILRFGGKCMALALLVIHGYPQFSGGVVGFWGVTICIFCHLLRCWFLFCFPELESELMDSQPTPPNVSPQEVAGILKGLLTIGFP